LEDFTVTLPRSARPPVTRRCVGPAGALGPTLISSLPSAADSRLELGESAVPAGVADEEADLPHDGGRVGGRVVRGVGKKVGRRHGRHAISHVRCAPGATL
jgi:hypothetical protein